MEKSTVVLREKTSEVLKALNIFREIQRENKLPLDLAWEIQDIVDVLKKVEDKFNPFKDKLEDKYGFEKIPFNESASRPSALPSEEEREKAKDKKDWWAMTMDDRFTKLKGEVDELLAQENKIEFTPLEFERLQGIQINITGDLTPIRKKYITKK